MPYARSPILHAIRAIEALDLIESDRFLDVGCGVGLIPILASLLTPARTSGVDFNSELITCGRSLIERNKIENVQLFCGDARDFDYSGTNRLYCFAPFFGKVLGAVLLRLEQHSRSEPIRIAGLSERWNAELRRQKWLQPRKDKALLNLGIEIFDSTE
jgi:SAM-dependent methyltransferase